MKECVRFVLEVWWKKMRKGENLGGYLDLKMQLFNFHILRDCKNVVGV